MTIEKTRFLNEAKDYIFITLGLLLYTVGWTVFLLPYEIVTGGVTGISAIIFYATNANNHGIPIMYSYFIINFILLILALKILGWRFLMKTIYAILMLSLMLGVMQDIVTDENGKMITLLGDQNFMSLIIGCCLTGSALAIVFLNNGSTGGTDIVAAIVNKYRNMSLGTILILVDLLIIGSSFPIFIYARDYSVTDALYKIVFGLCTMVVENFMLDYVMNSRRESVQFLIFSKKYQEIANAIGTEMNHGVTLLDGHGWYSGQEMKVLCILARKRESVMMFRLIKSIDPNAFVSQSSVIGVYGEGFDEMKVKIKKNENSIRNEQPAQIGGNTTDIKQ